MLLVRIMSSIIGIPLIIFAAWKGNCYLIVLCALVMILSLAEIYHMFRRLDLNIPFKLMLAGMILLLGSVYLYNDTGLAATTAIIFFIFSIWFVLRYPKFSLIDMSVALLATIYVSLFGYVYLLRTLYGWEWVVFMLAGTWGSDTFAYFTGKFFGKHKLVKFLSPGKTIEGAVGGVAGSLLVAVGFTFLYPSLPRVPLLLLGLFIGITAQVGDLVESAFKRQVGVKDAGDIIPGHGGMLDRFDSMLFTAPLVFYYVQKLIV